jgi:hypothetical protein
MHLEGYGCGRASAVHYGLACTELEAADSGIRSMVSVQGRWPCSRSEFGSEGKAVAARHGRRRLLGLRAGERARPGVDDNRAGATGRTGSSAAASGSPTARSPTYNRLGRHRRRDPIHRPPATRWLSASTIHHGSRCGLRCQRGWCSTTYGCLMMPCCPSEGAQRPAVMPVGARWHHLGLDGRRALSVAGRTGLRHHPIRSSDRRFS